jgi:hypothetical protein
MPAQQTGRELNLNHLRRGVVYRVLTKGGTTLGEYLGMEAAYGEHALLLRTSRGVRSIPRNEIVSIEIAVA